jgi:hypothetical protein
MTSPVILNAESYATEPQRLQFFDAVIEQLERRGHRVAVGTNPPVAGINMRFGFRAGDWEEEQFWGQYHTVSPAYFEVLGIPLVEGRPFTDRDLADSAPVVIISEALAAAHFDGDPVGREMIVVGTSREIVGVVGSVQHFGPDQSPPPEMYVPLAQNPWLLGHVLIRPETGFSADDVRDVVAVIDAEVPIGSSFPYAQFVRTWFAPLRFQLAIVGLLAVAGTLLAVVGLYALVAYVVAGRTREIGIRVALGETARSVFVRIVARGVALAGVGLGAGVAGALMLRSLLAAQGVVFDAAQPAVLASVVVMVGAAASLACFVPARRAAAVDPVVALRQD